MYLFKATVRDEIGFVFPHLMSIPFYPVILCSVRNKTGACCPHKIPVTRGYPEMFLLSIATCQGMQQHTLTLGSLTISSRLSTSLKSEIPFPQDTLSKVKVMEAWIHEACTSQGWYVGASPMVSAEGAVYVVQFICSSYKTCARPSQPPFLCLCSSTEGTMGWPSQMTCINYSLRRPWTRQAFQFPDAF